MATRRPVATFPRPEDLLARIEKAPISPLYLFYGDEAYLIEQAVVRVCCRLGGDGITQTFHTGTVGFDRILEVWGTPSLFGTQSVVVLKGAEHLKAAERERLAVEAELRDATSPLIVCARGRVNLSQTFFSLCAKKGMVAEFRPPFTNQLPMWAQRLARERGVRLSANATQLLVDSVGADLFALAAEIDKLASFAFPQTEIDADAVAACTGVWQTHSVFDLADAIGQRDTKKALRLLRAVLTDERGALPTLHALVSHFRRVWQAKDLQRGGGSETECERVLGLRGQRLRALLAQSRLYSVSDLRAVFRRAATMDRLLKSTRTAPVPLFDTFILEVCQRRT